MNNRYLSSLLPLALLATLDPTPASVDPTPDPGDDRPPEPSGRRGYERGDVLPPGVAWADPADCGGGGAPSECEEQPGEDDEGDDDEGDDDEDEGDEDEGDDDEDEGDDDEGDDDDDDEGKGKGKGKGKRKPRKKPAKESASEKRAREAEEALATRNREDADAKRKKREKLKQWEGLYGDEKKTREGLEAELATLRGKETTRSERLSERNDERIDALPESAQRLVSKSSDPDVVAESLDSLDAYLAENGKGKGKTRKKPNGGRGGGGSGGGKKKKLPASVIAFAEKNGQDARTVYETIPGVWNNRKPPGKSK